MQQRILVLGANGFIGRRLVARLSASDEMSPIAGVRALPDQRLRDVQYQVVDAVNGASISMALKDVHVVVNCVAGGADEIVAGAKILFQAADRLTSRPRVIYLSSMAVYGDATGLIGETSALNGNLGPYAAAKVTAEQIAAAYPESVVLRPGSVYGPGSVQWTTRFGQWLLSRRLGDLGAQGDGYCNLVHVHDVVEAIVRSMSADLAQPAIFNLSLPNPPTWNEYLVCYGRALGAVPIRRISRRQLMIEGKLLAPPLKIAEIALRKAKLRVRLPPPMPPSLLRLMQQEIRLDVRRIEQQFGFHWTPLEDGVEDAARWFLSTQRAS